MQIIPIIVKLPELGQVWGDQTDFATFKQAVQGYDLTRWQDLSAQFKTVTRDRGYILELPAGKQLDALLAGTPQLFSLKIVFDNPEAAEAQVQYGFESYLTGGILMDFPDRPLLSVHT